MSAGRLAGRVAAVTGASSGIGAAVAEALAGEGAAVVGFARRFGAGPAAPPAPGVVREVGLDVTDEAAVAARFAELGAVDVLVLGAGGGVFAPIEATSAADLRALLEVHVVGSFLCARAAVPALRRGGRVVVLGSIATEQSFVENGAYAAAKMGQLGLCRVLREELRPRGVGVTYLAIGPTDTAIWDSRPGFSRAEMMRPAEVAAAVANALASPIEHLTLSKSALP